ncbi:MAG: DNA-binding protein [Oscillospiraceae bacterium]
MKESNYKSYDELPLFLNAATVLKVLGIAPSSSYELMRKRFPRAANPESDRRSKEAFIRWVEQHTGGQSEAQSLADTRSGQDTSHYRRRFSRWV